MHQKLALRLSCVSKNLCLVLETRLQCWQASYIRYMLFCMWHCCNALHHVYTLTLAHAVQHACISQQACILEMPPAAGQQPKRQKVTQSAPDPTKARLQMVQYLSGDMSSAPWEAMGMSRAPVIGGMQHVYMCTCTWLCKM